MVVRMARDLTLVAWVQSSPLGTFFGVLLKTYNALFKYFCVHLLHCQPIWNISIFILLLL